jgi:exopolyphosphatase/guanosine-5'-triphosphate,3'-diphosphate pyrophosphatase
MGEVVELIKEKADINIEIIDGKREAAIIASTDLHHLLKQMKLIFVDVGGGVQSLLFSQIAK